MAMEMRMDNPCDRVLPVLGPQNDIVQHMQALPHKDVAAAVETVRASGSAAPAIKLALEFLVLTAARSDLFERRRRLMNDWSAYLDGRRQSVDPTCDGPTTLRVST